MAQAPKKKRLLPKNIAEKSDSEVAEKLFGKAAKQELDRLIDAPKKSIKEV
jgi:hypothetical protein